MYTSREMIPRRCFSVGGVVAGSGWGERWGVGDLRGGCLCRVWFWEGDGERDRERVDGGKEGVVRVIFGGF